MTAAKRRGNRPALADHATVLAAAIRADGRHDHVTVKVDRGFLYGDSVYEVLRIYSGKPWLEEGHFRRFEESLRAIRITGIDVSRMRQRMHETIRAGVAALAEVCRQEFGVPERIANVEKRAGSR